MRLVFAILKLQFAMMTAFLAQVETFGHPRHVKKEVLSSKDAFYMASFID